MDVHLSLLGREDLSGEIYRQQQVSILSSTAIHDLHEGSPKGHMKTDSALRHERTCGQPKGAGCTFGAARGCR